MEMLDPVIIGTSIGWLSSTTPRRSLFSKSRAAQVIGRCGQGTSHSGCLRGVSLPTHWRPRRPKRKGVRSQDGGEARCHSYLARGRAVPPNKFTQVCHVAVPRERAPLEECIRAESVKCTKWLQVCGKKHVRVWLPTTCTPWRAKSSRCRLGCPSPGLPLNNFDEEDAQTQYEDDEPQNDAWQAVFDNGEEMRKSARHPRLGPMSVHLVHRIFQHRGVMVWVKCGRYSMWVDRKLRRDCLGNLLEVGYGGPQENGEPRTPTAMARVVPLCRHCAAWRVFERDLGHLAPWEENEPFPSFVATLLLVRRVGFKSTLF